MKEYDFFIKNDLLKFIIKNWNFNVLNETDTIEFEFEDIKYQIKKIYKDNNLIDYKLYMFNNNEYKYIEYSKMVALYTLMNLYFNLNNIA